jgi:hypothetical protein
MTTLLLDPSSFSVLLEMREGNDYQPLMTLAYRRIADAAESAAPDTTVRVDTTGVGIDTTGVRIDTMRVRQPRP